MIARTLLILILLATAYPAGAASTLGERWLKVQQAMAEEEPERLGVQVSELRQSAAELDARRLTPYAAAMAMWAADHPGGMSESALNQARSLDPLLSSTYFLVSRRQWRRGDYVGAGLSYIGGWRALVLNGHTRRQLMSTVVLWLMLAIGWSLLVAMLLQVMTYFRQIAHDAYEFSRVMFQRPNAVVLGVVIVFLPVFVGLGPLWLLVYLFALSWAYMSRSQWTAGLASCVVLALLVPGIALWQQLALRTPGVANRVGDMLDDRRIDPATLREFVIFEPELDGAPSYHLVLGELFRLHGEPDRARLQFEKAVNADPGDGVALVFLGNLSMEDGDIQRAIQYFNDAIKVNPRSALAFHNLSSAFDQSRRFQEGDTARRQAREIAGRGVESLGVRGRDARIRFPRIGAKQVAELAEEASPQVPLENGLDLDFGAIVRELLSPTARVFWAVALAGVVIHLLRGRWLWTAQICSKCGKVFCPRCKTATESASYCSQCISVFLKRDMVSIEQQSTKLAQIKRWLLLSSMGRKLAGLLIPGSHSILTGSLIAGLTISFVAWFLLGGAVLWAPLMVPSVVPEIPTAPLQIVLGVGFCLIWFRSVVVAWTRR